MGKTFSYQKNRFREIFKFADLGENDIFYHLGCGNEKGLEIAIKEFKVKKAVGIDTILKKFNMEKKFLNKKIFKDN